MFVQKIFNKLVGVFSVVGSWTVDNLKLDGNTLSSTTGDINITPEGTSNVVISKGDINSGTIDATSIGATTASTGKFTTISASGQITNTVASGTAPLVITSPTVVTNLNADLLDGNEASVFATVTSLNNVLNGTTDFTKLDVDNLVLDSNTMSSVSGKIILAPLSGQDLELTPAGVGNVNITANDLEMAGVVRISSAGLATLLTGSTVGNLTLANGSITDSSGAISFDNENLTTTGTGTFNGLISPDIKALLASHDYQYVYDWSAAPADSNHKWTSSVGTGASQNAAGGELTITDVGGAVSNLLNYREAGTILDSSVVIIEHTGRMVSASTDDIMFLKITEATDQGGGTYKTIPLYWKAAGTGVIFGSTLVLLDPTVNHTYTVIKDKTIGAYLFIDGVFKLFIAYASLGTSTGAYGTDRNILFGTSLSSSTATCVYISSSLKYSIIKEGSKANVSTSSKIVGGNLDVKNQAESAGLQVSSTAITSTGTHQDVNITPNGTGDTNITTGDLEMGGTARINADGSFSPATLADAAAANNTIYYSSTASKLVYKDGAGSVNNLY